MFQSGLLALVTEIESHCLGKAVVTFLRHEGEVLVCELQREGDRVRYRHRSREQFMDDLLTGSNPVGSIVLRSFTSQRDELTQLPIKELRGYFVQGDGKDVQFEKLSPEAMFACQNTDAETGEPLPLEQAVKYC